MDRTQIYTEKLARAIRTETVSHNGQTDLTAFYKFHDLLKEMFPNVFATCDVEDFDGSLLLRWRGKSADKPYMFMNHHDVVGPDGAWAHEPFGAEIEDGKLWGRGTLDTKGGLICMLQAAEELIADGVVPERDIYFESACTEECDGRGANTISQELQKRGLRFALILDEGGMIVHDPVGGADGDFAMIGVGEKDSVTVKFSATSTGGHASAPGKNTPLVRLAKMMCAVEKSHIFTRELNGVTQELFVRCAQKMKGPLKFVLGRPKAFAPLLKLLLPAVSPTAGAMLATTAAFTVAKGSDAFNCLPVEAYVLANLRISHHQGKEKSLAAMEKIAKKYNVIAEVTDPGFASPISDIHSEAFRKLEDTVKKVFPDVIPAPFVTNTASDNRFMSRVSDARFGFTPFRITDEQLASIHGLDENIDISNLTTAVDFYKELMQ